MVDHALTSPTAYALGVHLQVEDPFLNLSDHGILRVQLPAFISQTPHWPAPTGARVCVRWEPGSEPTWPSTWTALCAWTPCRQLCSWGTLTLRQLPWSQYCLRLAQPWTLPAMLGPTIRTRTASPLHPGGLRIAGVPGVLGEQPRGRTAQLPGRLGVRGLSSAGLVGQQPGPQLRSCRTS